MNEKKEVLSVKIEPVYKELLAAGANYVKSSQGDLVARATKKYITDSTDYIQFLSDNCKKHGLNLSDIIHRSVTIESDSLLKNESLLIQNFYDLHDLWANEIFEDIPLEKITKDMIEDSDYYSDWESFIRQEIRNVALNRIDSETNEILKISSDLLLTLMPNLEKILNVEIEVQVSLFSTSRPIIMAFYLELICKIFKTSNSPFSGFHHGQLSEFMKKLTDTEVSWFYTVFHLLESEFRHKAPSDEKATEFLNEIFTQNTYAIFKSVKIDTIIEKAIATPGPYSFFNK